MQSSKLSDRPWLRHYPKGIPASIDAGAYTSLLPLLDESLRGFRPLPALRFMGKAYTYGDVDALSCGFAAFLQSLGLARGDRVALMMPNLPQYPVAALGVLRAGLVVVNINPLYTPRELEEQLRDADPRAIVVLENFAATLAAVLPALPSLRHVVRTSIGELLDWPKRAIVDLVVRHVKKLVPPYALPGAHRFSDALRAGDRLSYRPPDLTGDDLAVLQYTGGTTGTSKGAMLLHRNLVANVLQGQAWQAPAFAKVPKGEQLTCVAALPLYHIFGFTGVMLLGLRHGACNLLIPNPRDLPALFKALSGERVHSFPAVNTLFAAMLRHPQFGSVDWSHLVLCIGGGMAVQAVTAQAWLDQTGCPVCEGYGLSETSPSTICNSVVGRTFTGAIGFPLPSTDVTLLDDTGAAVGPGMAGEIAIRGPQVMAGYWRRPAETAAAIDANGWFRTGDIGTIDASGAVRLVDRKKDVVLVGGFNVYPTEIEEVVSRLPGVMECAAVGAIDETGREFVKLVVVPGTPAPDEARIRAWCEEQLTGYKRPKLIEFRTELPKSPVGKVLRRLLRDAPGHRDVVTPVAADAQ